MFGDVVDSRRGSTRSTAFLRALRSELESAYPEEVRPASIGLTQGDELQVLLAPGADPFAGVLRAGLRSDAEPMRWAIVAGEVDPGTGPAIERTGPAFLEARERLERAKVARQALVARTHDPDADGLLDDLGPLLPALLSDLTDRQREAARLLLIEGLRRADVADRLAVTRATVSVLADRAHVRELGGLQHGLATIFRTGEAAA
jgi:hypothetical protein